MVQFQDVPRGFANVNPEENQIIDEEGTSQSQEEEGQEDIELVEVEGQEDVDVDSQSLQNYQIYRYHLT